MQTDRLAPHLREQFQYTAWANGQIIEALAQMSGAPPERALEFLSHLLRSQDVWISRVRGDEAAPAFWEKDTLEQCRARAEASSAAWLDYLKACAPEDFGETIRYENSKGAVFENELRNICSHVVNHSAHHRAQIAMLLREAGGEPPATDYIFYVRAQQA